MPDDVHIRGVADDLAMVVVNKNEEEIANNNKDQRRNENIRTRVRTLEKTEAIMLKGRRKKYITIK